MRIGVFIVAAAIALPFLIGTIVFLMALRRRRAAVHDREQIDEGDARDLLVALGEDIQSLDLDVDMPNASPRGREEYERALDLYDRANRLLSEGRPERGRAVRGAPLDRGGPQAAGGRARRARRRPRPSRRAGSRRAASASSTKMRHSADLPIADGEREEELGLDLDAALPAATALEGGATT